MDHGRKPQAPLRQGYAGRGHWTTVVSDALDQAAFRRYLESSAKLQALEEKGLEHLPTFGG